MKKLLFLLVFPMALSAQNTIVKKDGTRLEVYSIDAHLADKQVHYTANSKEGTLSFKELDSAVIGPKVLKRFDIKKKAVAYFILTSANGKYLGVTSKKVAQNRGGFESIVTRYEIAVFDKGQLVKKMSFTGSKKASEVAKRKEFFALASDHFKTCDKFMDRIALFEGDDDAAILLNYLDSPEYLKCR